MHRIERIRVLHDPLVPGRDVHRLVDDGGEDMVRRRDADEGENDDGGEQGELGAAGHTNNLNASLIFYISADPHQLHCDLFPQPKVLCRGGVSWSGRSRRFSSSRR